MSKDDKKLITPKQIMSRIYSIARGVVSPEYLIKQIKLDMAPKKKKKKKGGTIKK